MCILTQTTWRIRAFLEKIQSKLWFYIIFDTVDGGNEKDNITRQLRLGDTHFHIQAVFYHPLINTSSCLVDVTAFTLKGSDALPQSHNRLSGVCVFRYKQQLSPLESEKDEGA